MFACEVCSLCQFTSSSLIHTQPLDKTSWENRPFGVQRSPIMCGSTHRCVSLLIHCMLILGSHHCLETFRTCKLGWYNLRMQRLQTLKFSQRICPRLWSYQRAAVKVADTDFLRVDSVVKQRNAQAFVNRLWQPVSRHYKLIPRCNWSSFIHTSKIWFSLTLIITLQKLYL